MVSQQGAVSAPSSETASRTARRRLITRALLRNLPINSEPRRKLYQFEQEMAETFASNRLSAFAVIPPLITAVGVAIAVVADPYAALVWGAALMAAHLLSMSAARAFLRDGSARASVNEWKRRFIRRDLVYGICWAMLPLLIPPADNPDLAAGIAVGHLAVVIIVLSVGALLSSPIPAAAVAATLPLALCMAAVHVFEPNVLNVAIAVCTLAAEILFLFLTRHLYNQHVQNLAFRAEKDALFAELEQSKAVSDEARRRAEAANMAKSQFLATMSHELRTPLNAILGFSELMRSEMLGPIGVEGYKDYLDDIHSSGQHLLRIINDILDLSRIEAGKRELREELTSLTEIAREARSLLDLKARTKEITVNEVFEDQLPKVVVDEQAMRQIVLNLISNALKFTPQGGEIVLKVGRTTSGGQYISVSDNGPGIPEEELPIVLSAFGQGSISIKTAEQGTGLGIPIVQALMHLHGGNFTLRSKVGVGTEAIATLPAKRVVSAFTRERSTWSLMQAKKPAVLRKAG